MNTHFFIPIFLLCWIIGRVELIQAQISPLSPNTAALFKTLECPIGANTGTVPVEFLLMSIGSSKLSASLSLSYNNTEGIKVREIASSVWGNGYIIMNSSANRQDANDTFSSSLCF